MKLLKNLVVSAFAVVLSSGLAFAVDAKKNDAKPAAKADTKKAAADTKADAKKSETKAKSEAKGALIDINTATEAELKAIPGLGDAYAGKIVAGRPYAKKDQLKSKNIIPGTLYEQIKEKIIAKQAKKEDAKAAQKDAAKPAKKK